MCLMNTFFGCKKILYFNNSLNNKQNDGLGILTHIHMYDLFKLFSSNNYITFVAKKYLSTCPKIGKKIYPKHETIL